MADLSEFSDEEQKLLVSLPYKVGAWISQSDDVGGDQDDEMEMQALHDVISGLSKLHEDMPFVHKIAAHTLASRELWPIWANQTFNVPEECGQTMVLLQKRAEERAVKNYASILMQIAYSVAEAWGEFGDMEDQSAAGLGAVVGKITGLFSRGERDVAKGSGHAANISASEDSCIMQLSEVLDEYL